MNDKKQTLPKQKPYTLWGRVQRLHGIYIPPKKVPSATKYLTLRFCLTGVVPSKKNDFYSENNYRVIMHEAFKSADPKTYIKNHLRSWIRGSGKYLQWLDDVDSKMREQMAYWKDKYNIDYPITYASIKTYYYFADNTARDFINKDEAIYDMLVKKKVIADDNYGVLYKTASDGGCYKDELDQHITTIDITVALFQDKDDSGVAECSLPR